MQINLKFMNKMKTLVENEKTTLIVPKGIRYISDWKEYDLSNFEFPHILDKKIPGCGYTEYCLTNSQDLILCSPRKILLENKESQHQGEVFYFKNELENDLGVDKDILKRSRSENSITNDISIELTKKEQLRQKLYDYCNLRIIDNKSIKIIVTYDSFGLLRYLLDKIIDIYRFQIVIDEFQSVFTDSRFKADTEIKLLRNLLGLRKVCFVSATPMIDEYLKQLDYFKDLPYFELDWKTEDPGRVCKPELKIRKTKSLVKESKEIIESYKQSRFEILRNINGELVQSKEAVFYVNSVSNIIKIINNSSLLPEEVNILCANTPENKKRLKTKLGKGFQIGSVPLRGEPHKMFTFCTRTVYLGADFYSTCARTFILSDANIESMAVDISLDLPQILGRQRLLENPWKNHAEFYFKPLGKDLVIPREKFEELVSTKLKTTYDLLKAFESSPLDVRMSLSGKFESEIMFSNYKSDYLSINRIYNDIGELVDRIPQLNNLVMISERRAFDIQQVDYKDRFTVFNSLKNNINADLDRIGSFILELQDTSKSLQSRIKYLCETKDFTDDEKKLIASQTSIVFDQYYNLVGPERCKALGYNTSRLNTEISNLSIPEDKIKDTFLNTFGVGEKYTKADLKEKVKELYEKLGYQKNPKATDLQEYFDIRSIKLKSPSGKWENGFEILKLK